MFAWAHSRGVKCTARSFLQCCPRDVRNRSVFLTFFFMVKFILCNFFEYSANTQCSPPSSGCLGRQARHKQLFVMVPPRSIAAFPVLEFSATNNLCMYIFTNVKNKPLKTEPALWRFKYFKVAFQRLSVVLNSLAFYRSASLVNKHKHLKNRHHMSFAGNKEFLATEKKILQSL